MTERQGTNGLTSFGNALLSISAIPGRYGSALIFVLVFIVLAGVIGAKLGLSVLFSWNTPIPLFGDHLNMTSLAELQWHIFSLLVMISGAYAVKEDRHIRVDVLSSRFSWRTRLIVDIVGDLLLLLPFFAVLAWYGLAFTQMAYGFGEQSNAGGLVDRYLIKAVLPLGSVLMLVAGLGRVFRNIGLLQAGAPETPQEPKPE